MRRNYDAESETKRFETKPRR